MSVIPHISSISNISRLWGWGGWNPIPRWPYTMQIWVTGTVNPSDSTTYYIGNSLFGSTIWADDPRWYVPQKGILTRAYIEVKNAWTTGTGETSTLTLQVTNDAWTLTETTLTTNITTNATNVSIPVTGLSVSLNEWDYISCKWVTPAYATNPTNVSFSIVFAIEPQPCITKWAKVFLQWGLTWVTFASATTTYTDDRASAATEVVRLAIPYTGTLTMANVSLRFVAWTVDSWPATFNVRYNWTSSTEIWTSNMNSGTNDIVSNVALSIAVTAWEYISLEIVNPTSRTLAPASVTVWFIYGITIT